MGRTEFRPEAGSINFMFLTAVIDLGKGIWTRNRKGKNLYFIQYLGGKIMSFLLNMNEEESRSTPRVACSHVVIMRLP